MRVRRSLMNFATMIVYTAVTTALALWSTPRLLHWLGPKQFGGFRVVSDVYGYLALLELGLGGAIGPIIARALGVGDARAVGAAVSAGVRGYLRVTALTLIVGVALTPIIPWFARELGPDDVFDLRRAWLVGLTGFVMLVLLPMRAVIEARQLGYLVNLLLIGQSLLMTSISLALAWAGWGITGQAVALVASTAGLNLGLTLMAVRVQPGLIAAAIATPPDAETRKAVRGLSVPTLLIHLSGRVSYLTDNLVIGAMLGTERVTSLYNSQRLATLGQTILQSAGNAVWASLAELHARGDRETLNRRLVELTRLVGILAAVGLGPVVAYNRSFVRLWLGLDGPDFQYGGDAVIAVAAFNVFFLGQMSLWNWCFSATGQVGRVASIAIVGAVFNLAASIALTRQVGLTGPLLGTTLAVLPIALWFLPARLRQTFGTPLGPLMGATLGPLAWGIVSAAGLWWLARRYEPMTWLTLALTMSLAALISLAVCFGLLLTPGERRQWRDRLKALRPVPVGS